MRTLNPDFCHKCKTEKPIACIRLSKFCKECLLLGVSTKFRQTLGKATRDCKIKRAMVCYSGGASSTLLLEFLKAAQTAKALGISEIVVGHVDESDLYKSGLYPLLETEAVKFGFEFASVPLREAFQGTFSEKAASLDEFLRNLSSLTSREDAIKILRFNVILALAKQLEYFFINIRCDAVILGDNCTRSAINVISSISKGRGLGIPLEVGLNVDWYNGNSSVTIDLVLIRPMRDILAKEVALYNHYMNIEPIHLIDWTSDFTCSDSIDLLTSSFILGLQAEFSSTVSTIVRTASKIQTKPTMKCKICQGAMIENAQEWKEKHTICFKEPVQDCCYSCKMIYN